MKNVRSFFILLALLLLPSCIFFKSATKEFNLTAGARNIQSGQALLVVEQSSLFFTRTKVYSLEKINGEWREAIPPVNATIGRNGFAPKGEKREGDGRTPSGIYTLGTAFGYEEKVSTKMPYRQVLPDDLWVDDINAPDYNRWVKQNNTTAKSFEKMRRDDILYKYGIVIEYNTNPVISGYGSAIFFHVGEGNNMKTSGCVAVSEVDIKRILSWLDPQQKPLIVMGKENEIMRSWQ